MCIRDRSLAVNFISPADASTRIHSRIGMVVLEGTAFITVFTPFNRSFLLHVIFIMVFAPFGVVFVSVVVFKQPALAAVHNKY